MALIAGPTASGKSALAVELAREIERRGADTGQRAVVVNADSAQVYADLAILSARPTREEMHGIDHRLFGTWDGADACSAAEWARAATRGIDEAHRAGAVPILAGGSGLYIRTLLDGIAPVPPIEEHVRQQVRELDTATAWQALRQEDEPLALALNPGDGARVTRALEVIRSTGVSLLEWRQRKEGGIGQRIALRPLILLPERQALYARCDARFEHMVEAGARQEVERLLARGLSSSLPVMRAIGVPQIAGWIEDRWSREDAIRRGQQATRNYAKRQYTWFQHQPPAVWPRADPVRVDLGKFFGTMFAEGGLA